MAYADHNLHSPTFEQCYRCYPSSFIKKPHLEKGDKVIMPASALDRLASLQIDYPMMFEISNPSASSRVSHCGVLEFVADEGLIYLPYWMMRNMTLKEGDILQVKSASLPKGKYVKLQPHTKDFLEISNPKAVLEKTFRTYSCLTTGDTIMIAYNDKEFYIDIVETKPSSAISIIETDCEVDFAPPLDYIEPEKPKPSSSPKTTPSEVQEEPASKISRIRPFFGESRRLDGKPSNQSTEPLTSPLLQKHTSESGSCSSISSQPTTASRKRLGTVVFGSNKTQKTNEDSQATTKESKQGSPQKVAEEPKFKPFSGKKYSLK